MASKRKKTEEQTFPGVPIGRFRQAVDVLVNLRDQGKLFLFLGRRSLMKLVGDPADFHNHLSKIVEGEISREEANSAIVEILNYCNVKVKFSSDEKIIEFLVNAIYDDEYKRLSTEAETGFRDQIKEKLEVVSEALLTHAMIQRAERLETTTVPSVEEVDVEVIHERRDHGKDKTLKEKFLRLRLRYSDDGSSVSEGSFPFWPVLFLWNSSGRISPRLSTFEFECDESDIDLLIHRLSSAKSLLLESLKKAGDSRKAPEFTGDLHGQE